MFTGKDRVCAKIDANSLSVSKPVLLVTSVVAEVTSRPPLCLHFTMTDLASIYGISQRIEVQGNDTFFTPPVYHDIGKRDQQAGLFRFPS